MRTTLTIDDDLVTRIEALRRQQGLSFKEAVNSLLREALAQHADDTAGPPYRCPTRRLGLRADLDPSTLNQLANELETDRFLDQQQRTDD